MCSSQDRSSLSVTPKYLNVLACSRGLSLILINKINLDLSQLRVSRLNCNHCEIHIQRGLDVLCCFGRTVNWGVISIEDFAVSKTLGKVVDLNDN